MALAFPPNPPVGTVFDSWIWDGTMWVCVTPADGGGGAATFTAPFAVNDAAGEVQLWVNTDGQAGIESRPSGLAWILEPTGQAILGASTGVAWLSFDAMTGELKLYPSGDFTIPSGSLTVGGPATLGDTTVSHLTIVDGTTVNDLLISAPGITIRGDGSGALGVAPNQLIWDANSVFSTTGTASLPGGGGGTGVDALAHLTDVSLSAPMNGQVLAWNASTQRWVNAAPGGIASLGQLSDVSLVGPTVGQTLLFNGTSWVNHTSAPNTLAALTDVTVNTPATGQVLIYTGTGWANQAAPAGTLEGLSDVIVSGMQNGQVLAWNSFSQRWQNVTPTAGGGGATALSQLTDVQLGMPMLGQALIWSGSRWVNQTLPAIPQIPQYLNQLTDVEIAGASVGQVLTWDGWHWQNQNPPFGPGGEGLFLGMVNDVSLPTPPGPSNGQVLTYDGVSAKWIAATPPPPPSLATLTDVSIPAPVVNQVLTWNGTMWVSQNPTGGIQSLAVQTGPSGGGIFLSPNPLTTTGTIAVDWTQVPRLLSPNSNQWTSQNVFLGQVNVGNGTGQTAVVSYNSSAGGGSIWQAGATLGDSPPAPVFQLVIGDPYDFLTQWNASTKTMQIGSSANPGNLKVTGKIQPGIQALADVATPMSPAINDVLGWDGTQWINMTPAGGAITPPVLLSADVATIFKVQAVQNPQSTTWLAEFVGAPVFAGIYNGVHIVAGDNSMRAALLVESANAPYGQLFRIGGQGDVSLGRSSGTFTGDGNGNWNFAFSGAPYGLSVSRSPNAGWIGPSATNNLSWDAAGNFTLNGSATLPGGGAVGPNLVLGSLGVASSLIINSENGGTWGGFISFQGPANAGGGTINASGTQEWQLLTSPNNTRYFSIRGPLGAGMVTFDSIARTSSFTGPVNAPAFNLPLGNVNYVDSMMSGMGTPVFECDLYSGTEFWVDLGQVVSDSTVPDSQTLPNSVEIKIVNTSVLPPGTVKRVRLLVQQMSLATAQPYAAAPVSATLSTDGPIAIAWQAPLNWFIAPSGWETATVTDLIFYPGAPGSMYQPMQTVVLGISYNTVPT